MPPSIIRIAAVGLFTLALAITPTPLIAQTTNHHSKLNAESKSNGEKKDSASTNKHPSGPFHGNLLAVDKVAKTISVGKRVFQITSETKIKKADKPATLEDGVVGEEVGGYFKTAPDGKLNATSVRFGPKTAAAATPEKKKGTEKPVAPGKLKVEPQ